MPHHEEENQTTRPQTVEQLKSYIHQECVKNSTCRTATIDIFSFQTNKKCNKKNVLLPPSGKHASVPMFFECVAVYILQLDLSLSLKTLKKMFVC